MTKDDQVEHLFQDLSCDDDTQPFHVVLVDIKKAADEENPTIHCVKKPLEDDDLKYVALSYRWGELQETVMDTQVGYTAVITSFDLDDFYNICYTMSKEADLKDMDYVLVDALCVYQTNLERRKATIHQMSKIYERAIYILAVSDLHAKHLRSTSITYLNITQYLYLCTYGLDIYHLINGDVDHLARIEDKWLDENYVLENSALRQLIKTHTDFFASSFMNNHPSGFVYCSKEMLDHLYETSEAATARHHANDAEGVADDDSHQAQAGQDPIGYNEYSGVKRLHPCNQVDCPLGVFDCMVEQSAWTEKLYFSNHDRDWRRRIYERSVRIEQCMTFLGDLIKDWSSRVWVTSEYSIAKKKNNLKYWFT